MRRLLLAVTALLGITTLASARNIEEAVIKPSGQDANIVLELRHLIATADQQLSSESSRIRLFAQLADKEKSEKEGYLVPSNKVVTVPDAGSWPELTVTSYVILMRDDGTIAAFQEVPVSESGDWDNAYTHYYDKHGNTVAFKRDSSFFVGCPDAPSHEFNPHK